MIKSISRWLLTLLFLGLTATGAAAADNQAGVQNKFVFHITDTVNARGLLNNARNLMEATAGKDKLVVVANGGGVDFMFQGATDKNGNPYSVDIEELQDKGVEFRVCNNTLRARKLDPKNLVDNIKVVPSGIVEVANLLAKEGYFYIKP